MSLLFFLLLKCPCVKLSVFWIHTTYFSCNITLFSLHTHTRTHCETQNTPFCGCKRGSPWRRDHSDTMHDLWVSAHFINSFFFFFFLLIVLLSDFQYHVSVVHDAPHINTTKSTTVVLVYKYIPFFQHKVYTFFYRGGILSVVLWNNNHFTPKEGFPKNCVPDGAKELSTQGLFLCVKLDAHTGLWHKMHNYHHLTFLSLDFFSFSFFSKYINIPKK